MRPRVFPAEDVRIEGPRDEHVIASMRPRVFPAEDAFAIFDPQDVSELQ